MSENRLVFRNIAWNALGLGLPLFVALAAFPFLIKGLGTDRFGVLALAWMVVGYFSIFDLGLGRALIKIVAEKRGAGSEKELPGVIYTTLLLMAVLGVASAITFWHFAPWLVNQVLNISNDLRPETLRSFQILSISMPVVVVSAGLSGILEAHQRFDLVNSVRLPLGVTTFLVPLFVLPLSSSLVPITLALLGVRFIACCAFGAMCLAVVRDLRSKIEIVPAVIPVLIRMGGWMSVSNIVSPLMVYLDRFVIGAMLSISAVTFYATPYEVVTRALMLPRAIMGVLFPEFSFTIATNPSAAANLYQRWIKYIFALMFPFTLIIVTFAHDLLEVWLGLEFADKSSRVLQLLAIGVLVNSLAQVSFGLIQSAGRPDITAKIHMFELPFYLAALWFFIGRFGITGAALVWMLRVAVDAILLFAFASRVLMYGSAISTRNLVIILLLSPVIFVGALLPDSIYRLLYIVFALLLFVPVCWRYLLQGSDRQYLEQNLKRVTRHKSA